MRLIRKRTTLSYQALQDGRLWQDAYHERVLRNEEQTKTVIAYLLNNPVRAGLVASAKEYPFSWSVDYEPE
jgi:hypothetical protein